MNQQSRKQFLSGMLNLLCLCYSSQVAGAELPTLRVNFAAAQCLEDLAERFGAEPAGCPLTISCRTQNTLVKDLILSKCSGIVYQGEWSVDDGLQLKAAGWERSLETHTVGRVVVAIIANPQVPVRKLSLADLRMILAGNVQNWEELGRTARKMVVFGAGLQSNAAYVLNAHCQLHNRFDPQMKHFSTSIEVAQAVARVPGSLGFVLLSGEPLDGVEIVQIYSDDPALATTPAPESIYAGQYPLQMQINLILKPQTIFPHTFLEFLTSESAATVLRSYSIFPESWGEKLARDARIRIMRRGEGTPLVVCGRPQLKPLLSALSEDFGQSRQAVRFVFHPGDQTASVERFAQPAGQLLVLDEPLSQKTIAQSGTAWLWLKPQAQPLGHVAVAVVVPTTNPVKSLQFDQVQKIFSGKLRDWWTFSEGKTTIQKYAVRSSDRRSFFGAEQLQQTTMTGVNILGSTSDVLLALRQNPAAVGVVSVTELPESSPHWRIVPLALGAEEPLLPNSPGYCLGNSMTLYGSPLANSIVPEFLEYLRSKQAHEILRQYGVLPMRQPSHGALSQPN